MPLAELHLDGRVALPVTVVGAPAGAIQLAAEMGLALRDA
jgi:hypothetical protein